MAVIDLELIDIQHTDSMTQAELVREVNDRLRQIQQAFNNNMQELLLLITP
jgi:hypothetical protein